MSSQNKRNGRSLLYYATLTLIFAGFALAAIHTGTLV